MSKCESLSRIVAALLAACTSICGCWALTASAHSVNTASWACRKPPSCAFVGGREMRHHAGQLHIRAPGGGRHSAEAVRRVPCTERPIPESSLTCTRPPPASSTRRTPSSLPDHASQAAARASLSSTSLRAPIAMSGTSRTPASRSSHASRPSATASQLAPPAIAARAHVQRHVRSRRPSRPRRAWRGAERRQQPAAVALDRGRVHRRPRAAQRGCRRCAGVRGPHAHGRSLGAWAVPRAAGRESITSVAITPSAAPTRAAASRPARAWRTRPRRRR